MAFGHSGDLEIELIEVLSGTSPHTEFLDQGRSGMHLLLKSEFRLPNAYILFPIGIISIWALNALGFLY
jgi:hypothetical protein